MKTIKLILFLILFYESIFSQIDIIDYKIKHLQNDSLKYTYILKYADSINYPSSDFLPYMIKATKYASKLKSKKLYATALKKTGKIFFNNTNFEKALLYFYEAEFVYKQIKDYEGIADCNNYIANYYSYLQEYDKALLASKEIYNNAIKTNNFNKIITAYRQIGVNYLKLEQNDSAFIYLNKAKELSIKVNSKENIVYNYSALGSYYIKNNKYKKAIKLQYDLLKLCNDSNKYILPKILAYQKIANAYSKINKKDSSYKYTDNMLLFRKNIRQYAISLKVAGEIYFHFKDFKKSLIYFKKSIILLEKTKSYEKIDNIYEQYIDIYLTKKAFNKVALYNKLRKNNINLLKKERNKRQLENIKVNSELLVFKKQNKYLLKQQQQNKLKISKYKSYLFIISFLIIIIVSFAFFQFKNIKKIKNNNKLISQQKEELQKQTEELKTTTNELSNYKNNLEKMVSERTSDLIKAKIKAEESEKLKTEFFHNMSHEIRTPLNAILGFSSFLNKNNTAQQQKKYVNIIQNSGKQLLLIIDNILEMTRLGVSNVEVVENAVCFNKIIDNYYELFKLNATEKGLQLSTIKSLSDKNSSIFIDLPKINKILNNLLENAIKYTDKGKIEFGYYLKNNELEIFVKDTGIGIKPENFEIIFKRFSQEEKELTKKTGGLGLGLAIAQKNAELIGSKIKLKSEKGKGAIFYFSIEYKKAQTILDC